MIKKLSVAIGLFLLLSGIAIAQQKTGWVQLKGELKNFSNQVLVEDLSELQYLLPPAADRVIVPDAQQTFKIRFKLNAPNYFRLGRNILYLSPGDDMQVMIDYGNQTASTFSGQGAEANIYLKNTPFPKGGSFIEAGSQVKATPEATISAVEALAAERTKELAAVKNVSAEFKRLETARTKADLINSLYSGEDYSLMALRLKGEDAEKFKAAYKKAIAPKVEQYSKNFTDASLMKLVVYRDIASDLIEKGGKPADIQAIKDWYTAAGLVREMQQKGDKEQLKAYKERINAIKTPAFKDAIGQMYTRLTAFGKGDPAVDFTAQDINGKPIRLSSLKGKVIYVDLWATWCGPCMEEMPHFEKLKLQYKDNPDVVFLSLSIDDAVAGWKANVASRNATGYQWLINRNKLQDYNIVGIPRVILVDKNFKIADMNAPRPSDEGTVAATITQLLK